MIAHSDSDARPNAEMMVPNATASKRTLAALTATGFCLALWACGGSPTVVGPSPPGGVATQSVCGRTTVSQGDLSVDWIGTSGEAPLAVTVSLSDQQCTWTAAVVEGTFVTIIDGASGTGDGSVRLAVARNSAGPRVAMLKIAGVTVTLTQGEAPCDFALSGDTRFSSGPGNGTINVAVTQGVNCRWTATSNSAFITVPAGAGGTGSGAVTFTISTNSSIQPRTGSLTIAGKTVSITQDGQAPPPPAPPPSPPAFSRCDVNRDGVINGVDVDLVAQAAISPNPDLTRYDINRDGVVNVVDVQIVINVVLGEGSCPP